MREIMRRIRGAIPPCVRARVLLVMCIAAWCLPLASSSQEIQAQDADRFGEIVLCDPGKFEYLHENDCRP